MKMMEDIETLKNISSALDIVGWFAAGFWLLRNWKLRREDYPKIGMSVECVDIYADKTERILEVVVSIKNEGEVRHKFRDLTFTIAGSKSKSSSSTNLLPFQITAAKDIKLIPSSWEYSFVDSGQVSTYKRLVTIPPDLKVVRCVAKMMYEDPESDFHSAIWHGTF
jgi:hypothetical protein